MDVTGPGGSKSTTEQRTLNIDRSQTTSGQGVALSLAQGANTGDRFKVARGAHVTINSGPSAGSLSDAILANLGGKLGDNAARATDETLTGKPSNIVKWIGWGLAGVALLFLASMIFRTR